MTVLIFVGDSDELRASDFGVLECVMDGSPYLSSTMPVLPSQAPASLRLRGDRNQRGRASMNAPMLERVRKSNGKCELGKLLMDFQTASPLGAPMDDDTRDLIVQLSTPAGMIMEDAEPTALTIGSLCDADLAAALDELEDQAAEVTQLVAAAKALAQRQS